MSSPKLSLASSPSLRHQPITHWPHHKTVMTSFENIVSNHRHAAQEASNSRHHCLHLRETSTDKPRPYVPAPLPLLVFQSVHDLLHPGTKARARLVAQRFVWPGAQKDYHTWTWACQSCQRSKVSRHAVTQWSTLGCRQSVFFTSTWTSWAPSHIRGLHILPHCCLPLHALAGSHPYPGYHSRHCGTCLTKRLVIPLRLPTDHHHQPGTSV
jgi:hypothetical protein